MRYPLAFIGCLFFLSLNAQQPRHFQHEAVALKKLLDKEHYHPRTADNKYSEEIFDTFLSTLDDDKMFFMADEIKGAEKYRTLIDNELLGSSWSFVDDITPVYKYALERAITIIIKESEKPFLADGKNTWKESDNQWATSDVALHERWRLWLNLQVLSKLAEMKKTSGGNDAFFKQNESAVRARVKANEIRRVNKILLHADGINNYVASEFLESVTEVYDPHTNYFNITNLESFLASMNAEGFYFGVTLKENEYGRVAIASLSPGSPAWKSGVLQMQDELVSLRWENEDVIDMEGLTVDDVDEILDDDSRLPMEFTVKKPNGEIKSVKLKKEKLSSRRTLYEAMYWKETMVNELATSRFRIFIRSGAARKVTDHGVQMMWRKKSSNYKRKEFKAWYSMFATTVEDH